MNLQDFTAADINDLNSTGTVALRKLARELGLKGLSSARGEAIRAAIQEAWTAAQPKPAPAPEDPKKGICEDCDRKVGKSGHPTLCTPCFDYAGWENTHSDDAHGTDGFTGVPTDTDDCPVCHPELDPRTAPKTGRSRAGMVIIAKGSEVHKSQIFKDAAEAKGWTVTITGEHYDEQDETTRYYADAYRGEDAIQLAWDGRAYDYPASSALINGKSRKVRNLKEALRLI